MIDTGFFDSLLGSLLILLNPILAVIEAIINFFNAASAEGLFTMFALVVLPKKETMRRLMFWRSY